MIKWMSGRDGEQEEWKIPTLFVQMQQYSCLRLLQQIGGVFPGVILGNRTCKRGWIVEAAADMVYLFNNDC